MKYLLTLVLIVLACTPEPHLKIDEYNFLFSHISDLDSTGVPFAHKPTLMLRWNIPVRKVVWDDQPDPDCHKPVDGYYVIYVPDSLVIKENGYARCVLPSPPPNSGQWQVQIAACCYDTLGLKAWSKYSDACYFYVTESTNVVSDENAIVF